MGSCFHTYVAVASELQYKKKIMLVPSCFPNQDTANKGMEVDLAMEITQVVWYVMGQSQNKPDHRTDKRKCDIYVVLTLSFVSYDENYNINDFTVVYAHYNRKSFKNIEIILPLIFRRCCFFGVSQLRWKKTDDEKFISIARPLL